MSIQLAIQKALGAAVEGMGDLAATVTYTETAYTVVGGKRVAGASVVYPDIKCIRSKYKLSETDGDRVRMTDVKLLMEVARIPVHPQLNANIEMDGVVYVINGPVEKDSVDAMYKIQLRAV